MKISLLSLFTFYARIISFTVFEPREKIYTMNDNSNHKKIKSHLRIIPIKDVVDQQGSHNKYCQRLDINPPILEDLVENNNLKLFHFMVLAILERGEPMGLEEIASRLDSIGIVSNIGNLKNSLKKAWHGREPVYKTPDDLYAINPDSFEMEYIIMISGQKKPIVKHSPALQTPKERTMKESSEPLSQEELKVAFKDTSLYGIPISKQVAAVLDAFGKPMPLAEIDSFLASLSKYRYPLSVTNALKWKFPFLSVSSDGIVSLTASIQDLFTIRYTIRKLTAKEYTRKAQKELQKEIYENIRITNEEKEIREAKIAAELRRAVIYAFFEKGIPLAACVLDCKNRTITTYIAEELSVLPAALNRFDLLAGMDIPKILHYFNLEAVNWRIIDLSPPQKTMRINKAGRTLKITAELLIMSSVGISNPFGNPKKILQYVEQGADGKLRRRIESNTKALFAFYNYVRLHGAARLRWGFLDEILGSPSWIVRGDPTLCDIAKEAMETGKYVEIVLGSAPGWKEPWSRAKRCKVSGIDFWYLNIDDNGYSPETLDRSIIQAIRILPR